MIVTKSSLRILGEESNVQCVREMSKQHVKHAYMYTRAGTGCASLWRDLYKLNLVDTNLTQKMFLSNNKMAGLVGGAVCNYM